MHATRPQGTASFPGFLGSNRRILSTATQAAFSASTKTEPFLRGRHLRQVTCITQVQRSGALQLLKAYGSKHSCAVIAGVDHRAQHTQGLQGEPVKLDSRISLPVCCDSYDGPFYPRSNGTIGKGPAPALVTLIARFTECSLCQADRPTSQVVAVSSPTGHMYQHPFETQQALEVIHLSSSAAALALYEPPCSADPPLLLYDQFPFRLLAGPRPPPLPCL